MTTANSSRYFDKLAILRWPILKPFNLGYDGTCDKFPDRANASLRLSIGIR